VPSPTNQTLLQLIVSSKPRAMQPHLCQDGFQKRTEGAGDGAREVPTDLAGERKTFATSWAAHMSASRGDAGSSYSLLFNNVAMRSN